jgi:hypothetical protein
MGDTQQVVSWMLERRCLLRPHSEDSMEVAWEQTADARSYRDFLEDPRPKYGMYGNLHITGYTSATVPNHLSKKRTANYPSSTDDLTDLFERLGGREQLTVLCESCPANSLAPLPAGCTGSFYLDPRQREWEIALREAAHRHKIAKALTQHFLPTTPLWYSLWATSPLPQAGLPYLRILLEEAADTEEDLLPFLSALERAERHDLKLHVRMAPPGHTDLGYRTIFPHCKAGYESAEFWDYSQLAQEHCCHCCGMIYIPETTDSSQRQSGHSGPGIRVELGKDRFEALANAYIQAQGFTEDEAQKIVAATEEDELRRPIHWAQQRLRTAFWSKHVEDHDAKHEAKMDAKERELLEEIYAKVPEEKREKLVEEMVDFQRVRREEDRERNRQHNQTLTLLTEVIFRDIPYILWNRPPLHR